MILNKPYLMLLAIGFNSTVSAHQLDSARTLTQDMNQAAAVSQLRIDESAEQTLRMQAEVDRLQEEVDNLAVYRDHLTKLVGNQVDEVASLQEQLGEIKTTRQGIVPLMYKMLEGLSVVIDNDKPIKRQQRLTRLENLQQMMVQADVSDAEKYRRILEAYQIEMDYGTKLGVYQGTIQVSSSVDPLHAGRLPPNLLHVELLHLGRIALVARSLDRQLYWHWFEPQNQWQAITEQTAEIDKAFNMAHKQIAPSLLKLPVSIAITEQEMGKGANQ
jgi:hypothetical protein